jgi:anion-transporting  ArsA/GET3 family ATPase
MTWLTGDGCRNRVAPTTRPTARSEFANGRRQARELAGSWPSSTLERLLSHRLLIVTGKGGVGKSTIAAVLALAALRRGIRTTLVEVAARQDIAALLDALPNARAASREAALESGLSHLSIDSRVATEEYLRQQLYGRVLATRLSHSRSFAALTAATPGLRELVTIGKVWELARPRPDAKRDLVILDAPASGHAQAMLASPSTFAAVARVGPIARQATAIAAFLADPALTALLAVCTAEEMPVSETLQLRAQLRAQLGVDLAAVVLNGMIAHRFSSSELALVRAAPPSHARTAALFAAEWAAEQGVQAARLGREMCDLPRTSLPLIVSGIRGRAAVAGLARELER